MGSSVFGGQKLVLTIGAPLIAGLSLSQLTGIVAHELGHFTQRGASRAGQLIFAIDYWFTRVVYERDTWDLTLEKMAQHWSVFGVLVSLLARFFVSVSRGILWCLMMVGRLAGAALLRQQEYNADLYQVRLVGPRVFAESLREITRLGVAEHAALSDVGRLWERGQLPADLPGLMRQHRSRMPPELLQALDRQTRTGKTGRLDTHPSKPSRISNARRDGRSEVFRSDLPATALLQDFQGIFHKTSALAYREMLGEQFDPRRLVTQEAVDQFHNEAEARERATASYFQGCLNPFRPLPFDEAEPPPADPVARLETIRKELSSEAANYPGCLGEWLKRSGRPAAARGYPRLPEANELPQDQLAESLERVEALLAQRLDLALQVATDDDLGRRLLSCSRAARAMSRCTNDFWELRRLRHAHAGLAHEVSRSLDDAATDNQLAGVEDELLHKLNLIDERLEGCRDPLDPAGSTLARRVLRTPPNRLDVLDLGPACDQVFDEGLRSYIAVMEELGLHATSVEEQVGLEPLDVYPDLD